MFPDSSSGTSIGYQSNSDVYSKGTIETTVTLPSPVSTLMLTLALASMLFIC